MIYTSVKEEDPLKVGRFGLGFKSVFHITGEIKLNFSHSNTNGSSPRAVSNSFLSPLKKKHSAAD